MSFPIHFDVCWFLTSVCRFGVELAPEVVKADGNVLNLAWRICNAKRVLVRTFSTIIQPESPILTFSQAPYSMSRSNGTTTPIEGKE